MRIARVARRQPAVLLARAHKAGANIGAVSDAIHARQGELGMRRIEGAFFNWSRSMAAQLRTCLRGGTGAFRVPEYRFVRRYLERSPQATLTLQQVIHSSAN